MLKKGLLLVTSVVLSVALAASAFAAGGNEASDWKNLQGYDYINNNSQNNKDGKLHPITFSYDRTGLRFRCDGYYRVGNPNANGYSGLILNTAIPVDEDGFRIRLQVNEFGGTERDDCWVGFSLLDKPNMWDNNSAANGAGMVALLRPLGTSGTDGTNLMMYQLTQNQPIRNGYEKVNAYYDGFDNEKVDMSKTVTIEVQKESDGNYSVSINGEKITTTTFDELPWAVKNGGSGNAYFCVSCSTDASKYWDISVKEINGVNLAKTSSGGTEGTSSTGGNTGNNDGNTGNTGGNTGNTGGNTGNNDGNTGNNGGNTGNNDGNTGNTGSNTGNNDGNGSQTDTQSGSDPEGTASTQENGDDAQEGDNSSLTDAATEEEGSNNFAWIVWLVIGVVVLALCGGGFFIYMKKFH